MYDRDDLGWLVVETVGQLFVEHNEVGDVDVAEVLFRQHVFADLIPASSSAHRSAPFLRPGIMYTDR